MAFQILEHLLKISLGDGLLVASHQSSPRAVPAIDGALVGDEQKHPVRITVNKARHGGILVLSAGIHHITF